MSNYIHHKVWDEITYPYLNFNGVSVEVYEWISNFIPHFKVNPWQVHHTWVASCASTLHKILSIQMRIFRIITVIDWRVSNFPWLRIWAIIFADSYIFLICYLYPLILIELSDYFNSPPPGAAYIHQWIRWDLVQIMACRLFGAKPLSEPILSIGNLRKNFKEISIKIWSFSFKNPFINAVCQNGGHFVRVEMS